MRSRTRLVAVIASLLVCIAMIGTGFASWVILATKTETSTGNVTAETVSDQGLELTVDTTDTEIIYGSPSSMEIGNAWLVEDKETGQGKFAIDFTIRIKGNIGSFTIGYTYTDSTEHQNAFKTAIEQGLVAEYPTYKVGTTAPNGSITDASKIHISSESGTATLKFGDGEGTAGYDFTDETTFHIIATFGWGSAFGNKNPYEYFNNGKTATDNADSAWSSKIGVVGVPAEGTGAEKALTNADVAKGVLGWMATNFSGVKYNFTFTATQAKKAA